MNLSEQDLSPQTIRMVEALLASREPVTTVRAQDDALVRFALGWLRGEEREAIIEALTLSSALRARVVEIRAGILDERKRTPTIADYLSHAIKVAVDAFSALEQGLSAPVVNADWESVIRQTYRGLLHRSHLGMGSLAMARSSSSLAIVEIGQATAKLSAEVLPDGSLEVKGEIRPADISVGQQLSLEIVDPVFGPISMGVAPIEDGRWRFHIPDFGPWEPGTLSASRFQLRFVESGSAPEIPNLVALTEDERCVSLPLSSPPTATAGVLTLGLNLDAGFRKQFQNHRLELGINTGSTVVALASWVVSDLDQDCRLAAPIPTNMDGPVPRAAISLRLVRT